jgi:hypothetical protein
VMLWRWERVRSVSGKKSFGTAGTWPKLRDILRRLNEVLEQAGFDEFCETWCRKFCHETLGRPSLAPGMYFRLMLIGFFEGIESERGIAWREADSLCLRQFLQIGLDQRTPDHVTISRTRRLMDEATDQEIFGWVLLIRTRVARIFICKNFHLDNSFAMAKLRLPSLRARPGPYSVASPCIRAPKNE